VEAETTHRYVIEAPRMLTTREECQKKYGPIIEPTAALPTEPAGPTRRYCFHFDEIAAAGAQGLPYVLVPRVLSVREWLERHGAQPTTIQMGQPK
jgi:hypothetical protein